MQMGYGLWQEQSQRLVMTPELRQAITVLQFSSLELLEFLEGELAVNPVIESDPRIDWSELARMQRDSSGVRNTAPVTAGEDYDPTANVSQSKSLHEHLQDQLRLQKLSPEDLRIGRYLIGNIDDNGYLTMSLPECAMTLRVHLEAAEAVLKTIQTFEPTGVGARDLSECLRLQLAELENDRARQVKIPREIYPLIDHYLEEVAQGRITRVASSLGVSPADVQRMVDLIKTLDPKPGRLFSTEIPHYIIPDVNVEKVGQDYVVVVNDRAYPKLHINDFYRNMLNTNDPSHKETREYINGKLSGALWLLKSLEQRRQTIYNVTSKIVEMQRGFFDVGVSAMKPLTLRQVAEQVGLHESTISRATTGKYAQTPRGVFELKYFFNSGVQTSSGDGASAESLKAEIRRLIQAEDPKKPLSDQKLTDLLQAQGIEIARRTVAKYREEEGLPSSSQRKRYEE
ncbi:RNA polymerase factor sigma-54 [Tumebacillus permanentifrigoris]|uniref:RNA polymerase RpoN-/SigL-like sigma 54 subunit n=1 Tax=Tumebacillus permanentifrigoris TaxID=378543 RepID=A0A316DV65_9BACL|nr:RNA polymerase factor sigma-54 [Tumebacillus permanentifrigoris]PWK13082.1 RNA polymerase RpoN-/SigL-like sigma 54 subunit [Tumebacillus permanentifrigoris]